jgi:hypothetical protein
MRGPVRQRRVLCAGLLGLATALIAPAASEAAIHLRLIATPPSSGAPYPMEGVARTADGALHVVLYANGAGSGEHNIGAISISPSGRVGPEVPVVSNWFASTPTLITQGNGSSLLALWGGNAPNGSPSVWGSSSVSGSSWSAPVDEADHDAVGIGKAHFQEGGGQWGTPIAESPAGAPPVLLLSGSCIPTQIGLGSGSSNYYAQGACGGTTDEASGIGTTAAVDAATGEVVAAWSGQNTPQQFVAGVAPNVQSTQQVPGVSSGRPQALAGRDSGPGVFGPWVSGSNGSIGRHVYLMRYGGGSVSVGAVRKLDGSVLGAATGPDGRIWVMWGSTDNGVDEIAVTRSNKSVTRFEPIQVFNADASSIARIFGDGRLGPLDLLVRQTPTNSSVTGLYYARVLPEMSAGVKAVSLGGGKFKLKIAVTDAGDAVSGATASAHGKRKATNGRGHAKLELSGHSGQHVTVKITAPGYRALKETITL